MTPDTMVMSILSENDDKVAIDRDDDIKVTKKFVARDKLTR